MFIFTPRLLQQMIKLSPFAKYGQRWKKGRRLRERQRQILFRKNFQFKSSQIYSKPSFSLSLFCSVRLIKTIQIMHSNINFPLWRNFLDILQFVTKFFCYDSLCSLFCYQALPCLSYLRAFFLDLLKRVLRLFYSKHNFYAKKFFGSFIFTKFFLLFGPYRINFTTCLVCLCVK